MWIWLWWLGGDVVRIICQVCGGVARGTGVGNRLNWPQLQGISWLVSLWGGIVMETWGGRAQAQSAVQKKRRSILPKSTQCARPLVLVGGEETRMWQSKICYNDHSIHFCEPSGFLLIWSRLNLRLAALKAQTAPPLATALNHLSSGVHLRGNQKVAATPPRWHRRVNQGQSGGQQESAC